MTIHHHLSDATLMAHAAGTLSEGMRFVISTHLNLCASCRDRLEKMEALGGALMDTTPVVQMKESALEDIMGLLDAEQPISTVPTITHLRPQREIPYPLAEYLPDDLDQVAWRNLAPGIKYSDIDGITHTDGSLRLLKIAPGATIPQHSHQGTELTLVLRGSYSDELGRFKAGDIADLDDDILHQPVADGAEDCICLIVTEGKLRFKTLVPKIVQYFTGM